MITSMTLLDSGLACHVDPPADLATEINGVTQVQPSASPVAAADDRASLLPLVQEILVQIAKGVPLDGHHHRIGHELRAFPMYLELDASKKSPRLLLRVAPDKVSVDSKLLFLIVELLAASGEGGFQLRRCFNDGTWFSPAPRSARSKFCSSKCRNRYNYEARTQGARFLCARCATVFGITDFSGLAIDSMDSVHPSDVKAEHPLCVTCILGNYKDWHHYLNTAELTGDALGTDEHANGIVDAITKALGSSSEPVHYKAITRAIASKATIKGRSPELTVLGYLVRFPNRFRRVAGDAFTLTSRSIT